MNYIYISCTQLLTKHINLIQRISLNHNVILSSSEFLNNFPKLDNILFADLELKKNNISINQDYETEINVFYKDSKKYLNDIFKDVTDTTDIKNNIIEEKIRKSLFHLEVFKKITNFYDIDLVFVSSEYNYLSRSIIIHAKDLKIKSINIEHGINSVQNTYYPLERRGIMTDYHITDNKLESFVKETTYKNLKYKTKFLDLGTIADDGINIKSKFLKSDNNNLSIGIFGTWIETDSYENIITNQINLVDFYKIIFETLNKSNLKFNFSILIKMHPAIEFFGLYEESTNYLKRLAKLNDIKKIYFSRDYKKSISKVDCLITPHYGSANWESIIQKKPTAVMQYDFINKNLSENKKNDILNNNESIKSNVLYPIYDKESLLSFFEESYYSKQNPNILKDKYESFFKKWSVQNLSNSQKINNISEWIYKKFPKTHSSEKLFNIIIVTFNSSETIEKCLDSVLLNRTSNTKISVIDNASTDSTIEKLSKYDKQINIIKNKDNLGFSKASNMGYDKNYNYTILLNPDTVVTQNWLSNMLSIFSLDEEIGAVGPISNFAYGMQNIDSYKIKDIGKFNYDDHRQHMLINGYKPTETKLLTGFCIMIRTNILEKLGFLDNKLFLGNDDLDLCWRLRLNNYKLMIDVNTYVYHVGQVSFKTRKEKSILKLVQESTDYLNLKLINHYGENNVPSPKELWGINWFYPTHPSYNIKSNLFSKSLDKKNILISKDKNVKKVSIVILTFNAVEYTKKCIESVINNTSYPYELIVVDNNSSDDTVNYLKGLKNNNEKIRILLNKKNYGFSKGNNQGVNIANGEYVVILNNDTLVPKGWLNKLVNSLQKDSKIGAVGVVSNSISGRQKIDVNYKNDEEYYDFAQERLFDKNIKLTPRRRIAGFCFIIKKKVYKQIGGFSEDYKIGNFEDDDFSLKLTSKGYAIMVDESIIIHHYGSISFKHNKINYTQSLDENRLIFKKKWPQVDYDSLLEIKDDLINWEAEQISISYDYFNKGELDRSEQIIDKVIIINPISEESLYIKGLILLHKNMIEEAELLFDKIIHLNSSNHFAFNQKGIIELQKNNYTNAINFFDLAINIDPTWIDPYKLKSECFIALNKFSDSIDVMVEIMNIFPDDIGNMERLSSLLNNQGLNDEAIKIAQIILKNDESNNFAIKLLGQ